MTMRLASEPTLISHGGNTVRLRPSLRAAYLLQRKHGIGRLMEGIQQKRLEIILSIVETTADDPAAGYAILIDRIAAHGIRSLSDLDADFYSLIIVSFGLDPDAKPSAERNPDKPFDMLKALADLFELATGWLGWSPAEAWAATPAEIMAAHRGLIAKLQAIHGSGEAEKPDSDPLAEVSPDEARSGLAELKALAG